MSFSKVLLTLPIVSGTHLIVIQISSLEGLIQHGLRTSRLS
jgi:hypothetical protein